VITPAVESVAQEHYPMRTVSAITGVNPATLRAWERRYGLIKPARTAKGHRLYTRKDIELVNRIVRMLERGISISQASNSLRADIVKPDEALQQSIDPWSAYLESAIEAIVCYDENQLDSLYNQALALYPINIVTERLLIPVLITLGERWANAEGGIAEEHFFGAFMRNKLGARFHHRHKHNTGTRLLACCLPDEYHEIGIMLFSLAAHDHGFRLVYLGPSMPLGELALTARRADCDGIVLSGSLNLPEKLLASDLPRLVQQADCPVFVGGQSSVHCNHAIERAGALPVGTDIRASIKRIEKVFLDLQQR
jgi:DNA-binding transcriptional MerR regulator/methylmalonyl-CoA mutase cobalamin-binding subunit